MGLRRRHWLRRSAAGAVALLAGPQRWFGGSIARAQTPDTPGRALYELIAPVEQATAIYGEAGVAGRRVHFALGQMFIWATQAEAEAAEADPRVARVRRWVPGDVMTWGSIADHGELFVCVLSLREPDAPTVGDVAAALWRTLGPVRTAEMSDVSGANGVFTGLAPNQLVIGYENRSAGRRAWRVAKNHPLVLELRWGSPRVLEGCPLCGIG